MTRILAQEGGGTVRLSEAALTEIVRGAVSSVEGARLRKGRRRLGVELAGGHAHADLQLAVAYGHVVPEVARAVQERVAEALVTMCEVEVDAVDILIEELDRA